MLNVHVIEGRLIKDPNLRKLPNTDTSVANGTISIKRNFKNKYGDYDNDLIHISIVGNSADSFCKLCQQGDLVSFVGRVQTDESVKGNGIKTYFTKTVIEKWNLLAKSAYNKEQKPATMTTEKTTNIEKRTEEFVQPVEENIPDFPPDAFEDFNPSGFYNPHLN